MSSHSWVQHSYKPGQLFRPDVNNSVLLLVDHQTGLNSLARDFESTEFKNAVLFLAEAAKEAQIPVIVTTSFETGPNGPAWPELVELFPVGTKGVTYIRRPGNINAWDDDAFTAAIKATGVKQLIIAGIVTEVCVAFPAISARQEGYEVFVVADASGTLSAPVRQAAHDRMILHGCQMISSFALACELFRDWRNNGDRLAYLCKKFVPAYASVMDSFNHAIASANKK